MKYYSVAQIEITEQSWIPAYVKNVTRLVEQRGGRYLARTSRIEKLEGERKAPPILLDHRMAVQRCRKGLLRMWGVPALPGESYR